MRSLPIFLYFVSGIVYASEWQQQELSVVAGLAQNSTQLYDSSVQSTSSAINLATTQLMEGVGVQGEFGLSHNIFDVDDYDTNPKYTGFNAAIQSRLFLSDISNLDVSFGKIKSSKVLHIKDARFQTSASPLIKIDSANGGLSWQLGSVEKLRSLKLSVYYSNEAQYEFINESLFREDQKVGLSGKFTNRVSEDTSFVASLNHTENQIAFANTQAKPDITGALVGFYTNYFGNSSLEVLIGVSNRKALGDDQGSKVFSWQVSNEIQLNDNSEFVLATKRELTGSPDPEFSDAELSDFTALLDWQIDQSWYLQTQVSASNLEFSDLNTAKSLEFKTSVNWCFNDYLSLSGYLNYQDYQGDKAQYNHSGNNVGVSLSWEVL